ncbi:septation protein SepH [Flaviflexus huanghaiensis]|uniref:septation protein SepH n=1 Tax=Flaviflexus huanghaiensis TaxID=1111473 RepID=UPI0015F85403|nr:septation protein SepH [Flaviflexus huanghaiensis]
MLELEFLGIQPDGNHMTLNDSEGNRYSLPITDELRAALRRDRMTNPTEEPRPMSPKDIQAHFRAGRSLEELSEMATMPASQLSPYEYPILAEREYTANQARSYRIGHEIGSLTVDELVTSRLKSRDVSPSDIAWSAIRRPGKPWTLTATYTVAGRETTAEWTISQETSSLIAINDEARWLSETEIPVKDSPWRPLAAARAHEEAEEDKSSEIVSMLDTLSARRGTKQPMVIDDDDAYPPAAHPPASRPDEATDATVLSLPPRPDRSVRAAESGAEDPSEAASVSPDEDSPQDQPANEMPAEEHGVSASKESDPGETNVDDGGDDALFSDTGKKRARRRRSGDRPAMPSWDEIVFGHPKE